MAMSLKKITAIAVGGAMVASALASGVAASSVVTIGDVEGFMKNVVVDGKPNVEIVVGSKAAAMDVVSAADIAAKIGSMCYKDVSIEDGSVDLNVKTSADTVLSMDLNSVYKDGSQFLIFTTPERSYTDALGKANTLKGLVNSGVNDIASEVELKVINAELVNANVTIEGVNASNTSQGIIVKVHNITTGGANVTITNSTPSQTIEDIDLINVTSNVNGTIKYNSDEKKVQKLSRLSTLAKDDDVDPDDVSNETKADAIEFLLASVKKAGNDDYEIGSGDLVYGTLIFRDGKNSVGELQPLYIGMEIPLLGETYRIVDVDGKKIYLGKEVYSGNIKEGQVYDLGNGYQVKVKKILQTIDEDETEVVVEIEIIKDGKVVESKSDKIPFEVVYKDVGVRVYDAYKDVAGYSGYASLIIAKDVKEYELGKEFVKDWKLYAITKNGNALNCITDEICENRSKIEDGESKTEFLHVKGNSSNVIYGLALKYKGGAYKDLSSGSTVKFANDYATLEFTDDGDPNKLFARYKMEVSKEVLLEMEKETEVLGSSLKLKDIKVEAQQVVPIKTPIAKLDDEASLDTDKYLILVGGPVANKLSEELQNEGKINIDNESPATLQVVDDKILVVAGGDRHRTREAALYLIENY